MSSRILAILFLTIATVSGYLRFNTLEYEGSKLMSVIFLIATTGFLGVLLKILYVHVWRIGESMSSENQTRSG